MPTNKIIEHTLKGKFIEYYLLAIILFLAFSSRLYKIDNPIADWHSWRQADTASVSKTYVQRGIDLFYPRYHDISSIQTGIFNPEGYRFVEFPIFNALHALLYQNFPALSFEVWGRLVSIFSALASAIFIFLIARKVIGKWAGVLSSAFFLFLPYNVYFTRVILPEPLATTFALASLRAFIKFLESQSSVIFFLSAGLFALSILVKPFTVFFLVPLIYLAHEKYGIKNLIKVPRLFIGSLIFLVVSLVPFFLWRAWMSQYPVGIPFFSWAFNGDSIRFRPSFWRWIFGERLGHLILGGWGLVLFVFGLLSKAKGNKFVLSFLLGMLLYVTTFATASVRHDYYQIFVVPAVSFALALGTLSLWKTSVFNRFWARGIVIFSIGVMLMTSGLQVKEFYKVNRPEIIEAGEAIAGLTPKDSWVIAPYNGDTAFLYQTERWGWPAIDDSIDNLIIKGADYYVSVSLADPDTDGVRKRFAVLEETPRYVIFDLHKKR